jgi:carboxypeptidase Q
VPVLVLFLALSSPSEAKKPPPPPPPTLATAAASLIGTALLDTRPYEDLVHLCDRIGNRFNGSPALAQAVVWGHDTMVAAGFQRVHTEDVTLPVWVRGAASAAITAPVAHPLHPLALGGSVGTPDEGIEAEVVVVDSWAHLAELGEAGVKGRIALFDVPFTDYGETVGYRFGSATAASKLGAVAVLVRSVTPASLDTPHTGAMRYDPDVTPIPAAAVTIEDASMLRRLAERGEKPRVKLVLGAHAGDPAPSANVVGDVLGREKPDEVVLIGCHLDSWDVGQGAQDDGAGCAIVLGAARMIEELPVHPRRSVRVVLFAGEEFGVTGGKAYGEAHSAEAASYAALIESDTGAGQPLGFRVDVHVAGTPPPDDEDQRDPASQAASDAAVAKLQAVSALLVPLGAGHLEVGYSGADVGALGESGVPSLGLEQDTTGYWPIHHTNADTVDKVDRTLLAKNTAAMAVMAYALADLPDDLRPPAVK